MNLNVHAAFAGDDDRWDSFVKGSIDASCYHLTGWRKVVEKSFGHDTHYLVAEGADGSVQGILPLVHIKSLLFGNHMISLPYFNYGGICAVNDSAEAALFDQAINVAKGLNAAYIEMRHTRPMADSFPVKTAKVSMRLPLPPAADDLWKSLPSKLRSQIRRPEKEGMYAKIGGEEEIDSFYQVFAVNMRDLGTPVYSKKFFRNILRVFPEFARICTVYSQQGQPAASGLLVGFKEKLEIPWASSLRLYNRESPNMLLYWRSLQYACEKGFSIFDFGRSTPGEGTFRFKEQWGAKPLQLYWHYWMRNGQPMPELNPHNPKYLMAIGAWQKMPLLLTNLIGPRIVRNLP